MKTMQTNIVNLTPHEVSFVTENETQTIAPSGVIARVSTQTVTVGEINGIPVTETVFGELENMPEPKEGVVYLVSSIVAQRCNGRQDVFIPNESVRDEKGNIIGCRSLGRV